MLVNTQTDLAIRQTHLKS